MSKMSNSAKKDSFLRDIKILGSSVREYKKPSIATPLLVTVESLIEILIPTIMAYLIDYGVSRADIGAVWKYGLILLGCSAVSLACGVFEGHGAAICSAGLAKNLRHDLFKKMQDFSFSDIERFSTGSMITRLTTDVTNVQNSYQMAVRIAIRGPVMAIAACIFAWRISPQIAMIFLCMIPILGGGMLLLASTAHPDFVKVFNIYDTLNSKVDENLAGVRTVKSFTRETHEENEFNAISERIYKNFVKAEKWLAFNMPLMNLCIYGTLTCISWIAAKQIVASGNNPARGLTTGDLTSLVTYCIQLMMAMMMVSFVFIMIVISRASTQRIAEVLNTESTLTNPKNPITELSDGSIRFENVTFRYSESSEEPVLKNVNIDIPAGKTIGIVGGTGSSKSTLVQMIPRLYDVNAGHVYVGGHDVREYDLDTLRDGVAMVLQKNTLFSGTIAENLRWGDPNATDEQIRRAASLAAADDFVQQFPDKYDTYIEQGGTNVSGGQKQRLCIARALLKKPAILILDDSTSAVDTKTDAQIRAAFATEIPDTTKIIIAQRISSVQDSDLILVMENGSIAAQGTHEQLLKTCAEYRETFESQNNAATGTAAAAEAQAADADAATASAETATDTAAASSPESAEGGRQ